ncbi:MAG: hypothetical protein ACHBN1_33250 [Heteroscytonema crispum UTEX LB 1556]
MPLTVIHTSALAAHVEVRISRYASVRMGLSVLVMFKMGHGAWGMGHGALVKINLGEEGF